MSDQTTTADSSIDGGASALTAGLGGTFRAMSDNAYCAYIQQMRRETCLGWEHKVQTGKFGRDNLDGFMRAAEWLGRHRAMAEAERMANDLQANIDALMLEYCPDEMTEAQKANWARHQKPASDAQRAEVAAALMGSNGEVRGAEPVGGASGGRSS